MTHVPPGQRRPEDDSDADEPTGPRRSTFTPPPADAEPPAFDDDALAAALAAQVSSYTSPVPIIAPEPAAEPVAAPEPAASREPVDPPLPEPWGPTSAAPVAAPASATPAVAPDLPTSTGSSSTLEAIERLENELRRRAEGARIATDATGPISQPPVASSTGPVWTREPEQPSEAPTASAPPPVGVPDGARLFPEPPRFLRPSPPEGVDASDAEPPAFPAPMGEPTAFAPPPLVEPPLFVEPDLSRFAPPSSADAIDAPPPAEAAPPTEVVPLAEIAPPPAEVVPAPIPPLVPPPAGGSFAVPPSSPPIDLPPPGPAGPVDLAHLPPPIGLEPAPLPPYEQAVPPSPAPTIPPPAPDPADFDALLGVPTAPAAEVDDAVDDVDRVLGTGAIPVDSTGAAQLVSPPSEPIPTLTVVEGEDDLLDPEPQRHPALAVEQAGPEPTPLDLRAGRAARLFWLGFAANSSVLSMALGAVLFGLGMSLRQALVAILLGVALSFLPLGFVTLAGKWSGQPTMIVSRAMFGLTGNVLPTLLAIVSRVFWGGALLWMLAAGVAQVLVDAGLDAGLGAQVWTFVGLGAGFLIAFVVAVLGYGLVARLQLVLSILTGLLVVGVIAITWPYLDLSAAQEAPDGPWALLISGAVLVFCFVGLAWVHSAGDVARYQRTDSDGGSSMLWATFGATLPAFALIGWGALLAASDPLIADGLATNPLHTIAALLPIWYPAPLLAVMGLGLISGAVLTIYSGGFAIQAVGLPVRRTLATVLAGVLVLATAAALVVAVDDARGLIRDIATTIAVPVAAWAGIFAAEMMIRRRRFHSASLLRAGGIYPPVRIGNFLGLVLVSVVGFGLTSASLPGLTWQGYLLPYLGLGEEPLASSDIGVLVALVLGILVPLVTGVPSIRRQERTSVDGAAAP